MTTIEKNPQISYINTEYETTLFRIEYQFNSIYLILYYSLKYVKYRLSLFFDAAENNNMAKYKQLHIQTTNKTKAAKDKLSNKHLR